MSLAPSHAVKTVTELRKNLRAVVRQVHRTGRPVVITVNGKPDVVLVDADAYEKRTHEFVLAKLLAEGEEDIRQGRTRPAREFLEEFKRVRKIPR